MRIARKHLGWYGAGLMEAAEFRRAVNGTGEAAAVRGLIREFGGRWCILRKPPIAGPLLCCYLYDHEQFSFVRRR